MAYIETTELFGTSLKGSIDDLNAEPATKKAGIVWMLAGDYFSITEGPPDGANLATHLTIVEEVQRHLKSGGINLKFILQTGTHFYEVRAGRHTHKQQA